jgi:NADH:ubiquinone oxidoreductase subunit 2 (subunit N)
MQSLCFYILSSFKRDSSFSSEAGLKYFISGAFISGIFLFGCTLLYGTLGTLNFNNLNLLFSFNLDLGHPVFELFVKIGVLFITSTLLFKIACAPFHF